MRNEVEEGNGLSEVGKDMLKTLKRFEEKKRWRTIKVRKGTYEQISKLAVVLGLEKYRVVDLSILILRVLMSEEIVLLQKTVGELGLAECVNRYDYDEKKGIGWARLDPSCVLKKLIIPFYQKKKVIETMISNLESLDKF